jgi:hypothetical protein
LTLGEHARQKNHKATTNKTKTNKRHQQRLRKDRAERAIATKAEEMLNATI